MSHFELLKYHNISLFDAALKYSIAKLTWNWNAANVWWKYFLYCSREHIQTLKKGSWRVSEVLKETTPSFSSDLIGCCLLLRYSPITFNLYDPTWFSALCLISVQQTKCQQMQTCLSLFSFTNVISPTVLLFIYIPQKKLWLSYSFCLATQPFRLPLPLTGQTQTTLSLSRLYFHAFPLFSCRFVFVSWNYITLPFSFHSKKVIIFQGVPPPLVCCISAS